MSGIYIPNMQMPKDDNGKMEPTAVWVYPNGYAVVFKDNGKMQQYTKAIPVPDHGDLIDFRFCEQNYEALRDDDGNLVYAVRMAELLKAPTIIHADEKDGAE